MGTESAYVYLWMCGSLYIYIHAYTRTLPHACVSHHINYIKNKQIYYKMCHVYIIMLSRSLSPYFFSHTLLKYTLLTNMFVIEDDHLANPFPEVNNLRPSTPFLSLKIAFSLSANGCAVTDAGGSRCLSSFSRRWVSGLSPRWLFLRDERKIRRSAFACQWKRHVGTRR